MARKILLADDSVTAQNMGRKILADAGYEVITVNNGSAALKKIAETKPDLIVLDVYMPGYSGLEVCQRLKETAETSRIPILLTVGKLEPFKPEEAKRVRAEGFIVKPFEASELLSALARLEDKMVPRAESSKPGRFARAIAAVEEGRYDKSVAAQEDAGWKNRIAFPSKKKRKSEEAEDGDDPAIYNPVNKDLRTVVEHKPAAAPQAPAPPAAEPQESRVDLAAVAPEGLPKDVTPEEIAALAAAAAHLQGKVAEVRTEEAKAEVVKGAEIKAEEVKAEEVRSSETPAAAAHHEVPPPPATVEPPAAEIAAMSAIPAEQPAQEKSIEASLPTIAATAVPSSSDVAAIDNVEKAPVPIISAVGSGNGSGAHEPATRTEVEPVTMAVAAGAERSFGAARWVAVPVALAPEEASVILEEEMRKAHVAMSEAAPPPHENSFAIAAEIPAEKQEAVAEVLSPVEFAAPIQTAKIEAAKIEAATIEAATTETATIEKVTAEAAAQVAAAAAGFDGGASMASMPAPGSSPYTAKEFETVAPSAPESFAAADTTLPASAESISTPAPEAPVVSDEIATPEPVAAESFAPSKHEEATPKYDEPKAEEPVAGATLTAAATDETSQATAEPVEEVTAPSSESHAELPQPERKAPDAGNKEPDFAATTAAAWANWRKIRESSEPGATTNRDEQDMAAAKEAAMAAAAGAEKAPDEGPEIESIVDSVLADLRPKIVAEISRKLKKKK